MGAFSWRPYHEDEEDSLYVVPCKHVSMNKFYVFGLALLFTVALAGCGGGGGSKKAMDTDTGTPTATTLTPAEQCVEDGGRVEDDDSCTSAADVAAEETAANGCDAANRGEIGGERKRRPLQQRPIRRTTPVSAALPLLINRHRTQRRRGVDLGHSRRYG